MSRLIYHQKHAEYTNKDHTMAIRNDRRTTEQKKTHRWLVTATDRFMSGWGMAKGGSSKCAWACETRAQAEAQFAIVKARGDMKFVNITCGNWYPRAAHVSIYVAKDETASE